MEAKFTRLKSHNPPSKQNAKDKVAPIRASVFMVVVLVYVTLSRSVTQSSAAAVAG